MNTVAKDNFFKNIVLSECTDTAKKMVLDLAFKLNDLDADSKVDIIITPGKTNFIFNKKTFSSFINGSDLTVLNDKFYFDGEGNDGISLTLSDDEIRIFEPNF
jgi:hypothetical protein